MEIVVNEDHVGCLLTDVSAILAHCDANVGTLESNAVVDAVTSHSNDIPSVLERLDDGKLMLWCHAIKHAHVVDDLLELHLIHLVDIVTTDGLLMYRVQSNKLSCWSEK